jgi:hypothetical protein
MPRFARDELDEMIARFRAANDEAGRTGVWAPLADFYTDDALYTWNNGPGHEFVARGRDQIRDWVLGTEMEGLEGWQYDYVRTLVDDERGEVVAFWKQESPPGADGSRHLIAGTGGSWFHYAGDFKWDWQRDFFDHMNAGAVFLKMAKEGSLSEGMQRRMERGASMPGWVRLAENDWYSWIPS